MTISREDAMRKVNCIKNLENYLALYITILGVIDAPSGTSINDYNKEQLKKMPRRYINSADALKLLGIKVEKDRKKNGENKQGR